MSSIHRVRLDNTVDKTMRLLSVSLGLCPFWVDQRIILIFRWITISGASGNDFEKSYP
jgi:hypothetical protein